MDDDMLEPKFRVTTEGSAKSTRVYFGEEDITKYIKSIEVEPIKPGGLVVAKLEIYSVEIDANLFARIKCQSFPEKKAAGIFSRFFK